MKKKFIEWDLPLKEISEESAREKNIRHGHPSTLHIWWARKPLASSRATNFASLIDLPEDPEKREEIKELIKEITPWEAVKNGNSKAVKKAREMILDQYDEPPKVLDPFAGGGSIPLEALRLGCETYASDYNPVAVFIEKATLEWPQKYGIDFEIPIEDAFERELKNAGYTKTQIKNIREGTHKSLQEEETVEVNLLAHMVEKYANKVLEEAKEEIGEFYSGGINNINDGWIPVGYYWVRTIPCQNPNCDSNIPLISNYWLSKKSGQNIAIKPFTNENTIDFEIVKNENLDEEIKNGFDPNNGTVNNANAECLSCNQVTKSKSIRDLSQKGEMKSRLIAVIYRNPDEIGKKYCLAEEDNIKTYNQTKKYLENKIRKWKWIEHPIPEEKILTPTREEYTPGNLYYNFTPIVLYGMTKWRDIYNDRQTLSLITILDKIKDIREEILKDSTNYTKKIEDLDEKNLSKAIMGYLGITLSNLADFNSTLCVLNSTGGRGVVHTFGRQALRLTWDYLETNVFNPAGASWISLKDNNIKVIEKLSNFKSKKAKIRQYSATSIPEDNDKFDAIFTDPPYYDNVPYANLSDFFYVWLKRSIGDLFPEIFSNPNTIKKDEIIAEAPLLRGMNKKEATRKFNEIKSKEKFENMLLNSFKEIYRLLKPQGIANIVYAHKTTVGWETMLNSVVKSGLVITASWPVHTERKGRLRAAASAALASSIYMVCRKTEREEVGFWKDIRPLIKERVEEKLRQFWNEGIAGGDFFISAIGPGMEIYSQYEKVERYSGEEVTTLDLLEYIRSIATDFVVNNLLKDASSTEVDSASQFYLAYRWTYLDNKVEFDDARRIASGMGIELSQFSGKGGFVKQTRKYTRVLGPKERDEVENIDNMVDVMHKAVLLWDEGEKEKIKQLLSDTGYGEKPAFWQFCQAVAETLLSGNKEKQLLEGFLMGRDKYSKPSKEPEQAGLDQYGGN